MQRALGLFSFSAAFVLSACPAGEEAPQPPAETKPAEVLIGVVTSLTGPNASYGVSMKDGIELALSDYARANDRPAGARPLRAIYLDDRSRAQEAGQAAQRLVLEQKVDILLGEVSSSGSMVMAPIAQRAHVPMITPSATEPQVTEHGDYVFRVCFVDPFQAEMMAKFARTELKLEKVAVLRDLDSEYSIGLAKAFAESFVKRGGKVVADAHFSREGEDFGALAAKVAASGAEAVYLPAYATEVERVIGAFREKKVALRFLGSDGFDSTRLAGTVLEGSYFTTHYSREDPRPENQKFVAAYAAAYNEAPDAPAALAYDAANIAIAALAKTAKDPKVALRDAIAATQSFAGITGAITLDAKRNAIKPAVVLEVKGGERKFVTRMAPE